MNLPQLRLSTLCLLVVIFALSFGLVASMKRHHDEVTQLRAELAAVKNVRWILSSRSVIGSIRAITEG
jgi:hypothetical protein